MSTSEPRRETLIDPQERRPERALADTAPASGIVCTPWAANADMAGYIPAGDTTDYSPWLLEASEILYVLSGQQFPGTCTRVVRPTTEACRCWGWQVLSRGHLVMPEWAGTRWYIDGNPWSGCGSCSRIRLAGYVQAITEVRIDGGVVDPLTYRVDANRYLVRLHDPTTDVVLGWPRCQDISLPADTAGTFEVTYTYGRPVPTSGRRAAAALAWQLYLAENPQGKQKCRLPAGWTSITRQGVTVQRAQGEKFPTESGIPQIDAFIGTYNPSGLTRPSAVYSTDIAPYAPRIG